MASAMLWLMLTVLIGFVAIVAILLRLQRQTGGGFGPTELSDGSMTVEPTGYPEEMKGNAKKISPVENSAAQL